MNPGDFEWSILQAWMSLRSCAVCVVDGEGQVLKEQYLRCEVEDIAGYHTDLAIPIQRLGSKSDTLNQHLFYGLKAAGFDARLVPHQHFLELDRLVKSPASQDKIRMRLIRTKGRRCAVVAIARKLAVLLHRMCSYGPEFRLEKVESMACREADTPLS